MHVPQLAVVDQLAVPIQPLLAYSEVETAPGDEGGFVRQTGKVQVGFSMKLRHSCLSSSSGAASVQA
jgi:hypothetical protein